MNQKYTKMSEMYSYKYPHPAVTTDCVIFGFDGSTINILLVERGIEPYKGSWALPGGFLKMDETVEEGALRELREETGVSKVYLEQFHVFSDVNRDPRERVLTVAFLALVRKSDYLVIAGDDAANAQWFEWDELPPLAFDHSDIIKLAKKSLQQKLRIQPIAFKLLNNVFRMSELQRIYEIIHETTYDRRNFARKMVASGFVNEEPMEEAICSMAAEKPTRGRAATLFSFDEEKFEKTLSSQEWRKFPFDF